MDEDSLYSALFTCSTRNAYTEVAAAGWRDRTLLSVSIDARTGTPSTWETIRQHAVGTVVLVSDLLIFTDVDASDAPRDARAWKFGAVPGWLLAPGSTSDDNLALACTRGVGAVQLRIKALL